MNEDVFYSVIKRQWMLDLAYEYELIHSAEL